MDLVRGRCLWLERNFNIENLVGGLVVGLGSDPPPPPPSPMLPGSIPVIHHRNSMLTGWDLGVWAGAQNSPH